MKLSYIYPVDSSQNNISLKNRLICSLFHLCTMNNKRSPSALYFLYFFLLTLLINVKCQRCNLDIFVPKSPTSWPFLNKIQRNILNTILITLSRILITDRDREVKKDINAINEGVKDIERKENSNQTVEVNWAQIMKIELIGDSV